MCAPRSGHTRDRLDDADNAELVDSPGCVTRGREHALAEGAIADDDLQRQERMQITTDGAACRRCVACGWLRSGPGAIETAPEKVDPIIHNAGESLARGGGQVCAGFATHQFTAADIKLEEVLWNKEWRRGRDSNSRYSF